VKWSTRSARLLIAAAAASGSALLVPAAALAAPARPASSARPAGPASSARPAASARLAASARPAAPAAPRCTGGHTLVWLGIPGSGAAGSTFYPLEFSNIGHAACRLFGYPGVAAVNGRGKRIGPAAAHSGARHTVTLRPGATAHAVLRIVTASFISGCTLRTTAGLRIFPPGQVAGQTIAGFRFRTCANKPVLSVSAVRRGAGIP
jgi:Protein of unknown function (DUF4232)